MAKPSIALQMEAAQPEEGMMRKAFNRVKRDPLGPIGMAGWTALVGYGIYNVRNRKTKNLGLYFIHLRVGAQAFVIGLLTAGVAYNIYRNVRYGELPKDKHRSE